jgi:hypothetical protein
MCHKPGNTFDFTSSRLAMQAKKYKIDIYRSMLDFTHRFRATIDEIYIEERQLYVNFADKTANVFKGDARRFREGKEVETIEISDDAVHDLESFVEHTEKIREIVRVLFLPKS